MIVDDKQFLAVSIRDTGGGIEPAFLDNIFNPFFTTKEKGMGSGWRSQTRSSCTTAATSK